MGHTTNEIRLPLKTAEMATSISNRVGVYQESALSAWGLFLLVDDDDDEPRVVGGLSLSFLISLVKMPCIPNMPELMMPVANNGGVTPL